MKAEFWHEKWRNKDIAFHENQTNTFLTKYLDVLNLAENSRIFLPLCGKTKDIAWLLSQGYKIVGAELNAIAVNELFDELGIVPEVISTRDLIHYQANNIDIFLGDIFHITSDILGNVDAVYDRAALVALPEKMRRQYTQHIVVITNTTQQLLITFEYDQGKISGPPFSISKNELLQHYQEHYQITQLESANIKGGLKGKVQANEVTWLLQNR